MPGQVDRGGTATLISDRVEVTKVTSIDRLGGNLLITDFELKVSLSLNAYAPQHELDAQGNRLAATHYYKN